MSVQLEEKSVGQHGANIYFKEFTVSTKSSVKTYKLGTFYFVRKSPEYPIAIAEFQLIWRNTKDGKIYASVKLYFNPNEIDPDVHQFEDTGKDEVFEADQHVVIECCKFPQWECQPSFWYENLGALVYDGIPRQHFSIETNAAVVGKKEEREVIILSFPQYCRYKTCLRILKLGIKLTGKVLLSRGGLATNNLNTIVLFSRWRFKKEDILKFSLTADIQVPVFKGRPRKKKNQPNLNVPEKKGPRRRSEEDILTDKDYIVPVTRAAVSFDTSTIQMKLKRASDKKDGTSESQLKSLLMVDHNKNHQSSEAQKFNIELNEFMSKRGTPILKIPSVGYAKVDLYRLYTLVTSYGGYGQVTLKKQWRTVYDYLGHSSSITNSATCTRHVYERLLLPFEKYLRNNRSGTKKKMKSINEVAEKLKKDEMVAQTVRATANGSTLLPPLQEGDAFKLMIQKRRGRPSKEFREKIEKLKSMKQKVKVEIYPPLSKHSKLPAWLNSLNVDIVNPKRKRRISSSLESENYIPEKIPKYEERSANTILTQEKPHSRPGDNNVHYRGDTMSGAAQVKNASPKDYNDLNVISPRDIVSYNVISPRESVRNSVTIPQKSIGMDTRDRPRQSSQLCEFEIKSVRSLAPAHMQPPSMDASLYIHYPDRSSAHTITVPQSVLSYRDISPPKQSQSKDLRSTTVVGSHYQVSYTFRDAKFSAQGFRQSDIQVPSLNSFITGDNYERRTSPSGNSDDIDRRRRQLYGSPPIDQDGRYHQRNDSDRYRNDRYVEHKYIIHQPTRIRQQQYDDAMNEYEQYPLVYSHDPAHRREHLSPRRMELQEGSRRLEHQEGSRRLGKNGPHRVAHTSMSIAGRNERQSHGYNSIPTSDHRTLSSRVRHVHQTEAPDDFRSIKPETPRTINRTQSLSSSVI